MFLLIKQEIGFATILSFPDSPPQEFHADFAPSNKDNKKGAVEYSSFYKTVAAYRNIVASKIGGYWKLVNFPGNSDFEHLLDSTNKLERGLAELHISNVEYSAKKAIKNIVPKIIEVLAKDNYNKNINTNTNNIGINKKEI